MPNDRFGDSQEHAAEQPHVAPPGRHRVVGQRRRKMSRKARRQMRAWRRQKAAMGVASRAIGGLLVLFGIAVIAEGGMAVLPGIMFLGVGLGRLLERERGLTNRRPSYADEFDEHMRQVAHRREKNHD